MACSHHPLTTVNNTYLAAALAVTNDAEYALLYDAARGWLPDLRKAGDIQTGIGRLGEVACTVPLDRLRDGQRRYPLPNANAVASTRSLAHAPPGHDRHRRGESWPGSRLLPHEIGMTGHSKLFTTPMSVAAPAAMAAATSSSLSKSPLPSVSNAVTAAS